MIKVSVCIGSACHLKGARAVVNGNGSAAGRQGVKPV